nr:hypothetical protein [Haliscomenobacter sp.]
MGIERRSQQRMLPTGAAVFDDRLYIYYGAATERIAASVLLPEL